MTLVDYERWQESQFSIEYKPIERNKLTIVAKLRLEGETSGQDVIVRLFNEADKYFRNFVKVRLCRLPQETGMTPVGQYEEGVYLNTSDQTLSTREYQRFYHKAGERYMVGDCDSDRG